MYTVQKLQSHNVFEGYIIYSTELRCHITGIVQNLHVQKSGLRKHPAGVITWLEVNPMRSVSHQATIPSPNTTTTTIARTNRKMKMHVPVENETTDR